jgi:hypothetical protein
MAGGDTLTRVPVVTMRLRDQLWNAVMAAICARRGHAWRMYGKPIDAKGERNLPFGRRDYCTRCESTRVTFRVDDQVEVFSKAELLAAEPKLAEALYEARWGERPKQKLWRGQFPAA